MKDTILNSTLIAAAFVSILFIALQGGDTRTETLAASADAKKVRSAEKTTVVATHTEAQPMLIAADSH